MKEPIITQKIEKEIVKTLKEAFLEFISTLETYFLSYGFIHNKGGNFMKKYRDYEAYFYINGRNGSYISYEIEIGVRFKKFDNFYRKAHGLKFKIERTNYLIITHDRNFRNYNGYKPYFYCYEKDDLEKAIETIKFTFENIAPEFYKQNDSLILIRDYVFATDISTFDYQFTRFQLPSQNAMSLVFTITFLYDYENIEKVLDHYKRMFNGKTDDYEKFEAFCVNKILMVNREQAFKKIE